MKTASIGSHLGQLGTGGGLLPLSQGFKQAGLSNSVPDGGADHQIGNPDRDDGQGEQDRDGKNSLPGQLGLECLHVHGFVPPQALYQAACTPPATNTAPAGVPPTVDDGQGVCILDVLVGCEYSGSVRDQFTKRGHRAMSVDLLPSETPGNHYQGDLIQLLEDAPDGHWDVGIFHPPCTHLAVSGARWFPAKRADGRQQAALDFVAKLFSLRRKFKRGFALENPVSIISSHFRKPDQVIQPWMFGHGEVKATCLWIEGDLPLLKPTQIVEGREAVVHRMPPGPDRWKNRSRTYQGIADAMAAQWGAV